MKTDGLTNLVMAIDAFLKTRRGAQLRNALQRSQGLCQKQAHDECANEIYLRLVGDGRFRQLFGAALNDEERQRLVNYYAKFHLLNFIRRERTWQSRNSCDMDCVLSASLGEEVVDLQTDIALLPSNLREPLLARLRRHPYGLSLDEFAQANGVSRKTAYNRSNDAFSMLGIPGG